jgi:hypothetical protein
MLILEESYKQRIQQLAGIITEVDAQTKTNMLSKSVQRVPFSRDMMKQAIEQGREVGLLFKSDNENYEMPVPKYRIIRPMAMGTSADGNTVIRGLHLIGQSERKARETGNRSAEAEGEWRLFNANNIKGMWFTDNFFTQAPPGYNPNDKQMSVQVAFNAGKAAQAQTALAQQQSVDDDQERKDAELDVMQKNIDSKPPEQKQVFAPGQFTNQFAG